MRAVGAVLALIALSQLATSCGESSRFYADGVLRSQGRESSDGSEEGPWTFWYPNGELAESGSFERGRRTGMWTEWFPTGQRRARGARVFDPKAHASPREGPWTHWYTNGEREAQGIYLHGKREGHWDYSHDDGGLDGDRTGEYHDDQRID